MSDDGGSAEDGAVAGLTVLVLAEQLRRRVPGGIGTYVRGLIQGLTELGPSSRTSVSLLASRVRGADPLERFGLPVERTLLPSRLLVKAWDLGAVSVGRGRSVVHATSLALPRSKVPLVATVHDLAWRHLPEAYPRRGRRWHEAALRRTLRRADWLVTPSEEVARELRELRASEPSDRSQPRNRSEQSDRVVVIAEGSDHLPPPDLDGARRVLDALGAGSQLLLTVGTLEPRKNLRRLFEAYELARPELHGWPLVVVGPDGWGAGAPAARPEGVVFAGQLDAAVLAALYRMCRCVAYVPLLEGYGLPVVEAMRAGAPVVASPVPSAGTAALEVDPLDVTAIARGLVTAASEGRRRDELIAAGRQHTADMTWARAAAAHVALWQLAAGLDQ